MCISNEPKLYTPYIKGKYSVSPNFTPLDIDFNSNDYDKRFFQIDNQYFNYINNKKLCRNEDIKKYYQEKNYNTNTEKFINQFIVNQLIKTYPDYFKLNKDGNNLIIECKLTNEKIIFDEYYRLIGNQYLSLFDALCSQIQEDIVVCSLDEKKDWLSAIHLCSPSYWSAEEKIGMNFSQTHKKVAGMEKMLINYYPLLESVFKKGPFYRFAWEVNTEIELNHHPDKLSLEKQFDKNKPELYVRVERQTVTGFQEINSILFTIRTYYYDIKTLSKSSISNLQKALLSMPPETLEYKRLNDTIKDITEWLSTI